MVNVGKTARTVIVSLIGFPLLMIGIILIPIPGPGLLVCLLALFILSFEFNWATLYLQKAKIKFRKVYANAKARADKIEKMADKADKK